MFGVYGACVILLYYVEEYVLHMWLCCYVVGVFALMVHRPWGFCWGGGIGDGGLGTGGRKGMLARGVVVSRGGRGWDGGGGMEGMVEGMGG